MIKKFLLLILLNLFCVNILFAETLKAGISYTVDSARIIAFKEIDNKIDISKYQRYFVDENNVENLRAIGRHKNKYKDRILNSYSNGDYSICYLSQLNICFYYDSNGNLQYMDFIYGEDYPKKSATYNKDGYLDSTCLRTVFNEQYIFDINKNLVAHWIGKNCYNEKGELVLTRD